MRDLLLGHDTIDLDVVVTGDALALARALQPAIGGDAAARLRLHEQFGTAMLLLAAGPTLDLITARREYYPAPGALPVVTAGSLDDDLRRRDFTINALLLTLDTSHPATLLDPLGGREDLARGLLRVLHDGSFVDDPTRILRGLRYAGRLDYCFEPHTDALCRAALVNGALGTVSIQRLSHELVRILSEARTAAILDRADAYGLLARFPVPLRWDAAARQSFVRLDLLWSNLTVPSRFALWEARFALLVATLPLNEARASASGLHLTSGALLLAEQVSRLRALVDAGPLPARNATLGRLLDPFEPSAIIAVAAYCDDEAVRSTLVHYLATIRPLTPSLNGEALKALGLPPGPIYRLALAALRDYKRDQPTVTAEDERAFLLSWLVAREGEATS